MKEGVFNKEGMIEAVNRLNEKELLFLNRIIVERLKFISQAKSTLMMSSFTAGERVCFSGKTGN